MALLSSRRIDRGLRALRRSKPNSTIGGRSCATVFAATSPPRWPPMPSTTRNNPASGSATKASSFLSRHLPISVAAAHTNPDVAGPVSVFRSVIAALPPVSSDQTLLAPRAMRPEIRVYGPSTPPADFAKRPDLPWLADLSSTPGAIPHEPHQPAPAMGAVTVIADAFGGRLTG